MCQAVEQLARSRYLLGEVIVSRYLLGEVIVLAAESPELTDAELRDRLTALADRPGTALATHKIPQLPVDQLRISS